jgi:hypothetical protein
VRASVRPSVFPYICAWYEASATLCKNLSLATDESDSASDRKFEPVPPNTDVMSARDIKMRRPKALCCKRVGVYPHHTYV